MSPRILRILVAHVCLALLLSLVGCACDGGPGTAISAQLATDLTDNRLVFNKQLREHQQKQFLLFNQGEAPVTVYGVTLLGDDEDKFVIVDPPAFPLELKPGKSDGIAIQVQLKPGALASDVARLAFLLTPPDIASTPPEVGEGTFFVSVQREVIREPLQLSCKDGLDFGVVMPGRSKTMACDISNRSNDTITISHVSYRPTSGHIKEFSLRDAVFPMRMAPGQQRTLLVVYKPEQDGFNEDGGHLVIESDQVLAPDEMAPSIRVSAKTFVDNSGPPCLVSSLPKLDFGSMRASCRQSGKSLLVENRGGVGCQSIRLTSALIQPPSEGFALLLAPPSTRLIKPGEKVEIKVRFHPLAPRNHQAVLVIQTSQGYHATLFIPLFGVGGRGSPDDAITDEFRQLEKPKTDILFVIDNSASMGSEQVSLRDNVTAFARWMVRLNVDYHAMVINTDVSGKTHPAGCARGAVKVVTSKLSDPVSALVENANVGTQGDNKPKGLRAAVAALTAPRLDDPKCNLGFYRQDAALSMIFVSNNLDHSSQEVDEYATFFKKLKGIRNGDLIRGAAIVGPPGGCQQSGEGLVPYGQRYWKLAQLLRGVQASICSDHWAPTLTNIGSITFGFRTQYFLSHPADPLTIVVKVNHQEIKQDQYEGWEYDAVGNAIVFAKAAIPPPGSKISVTYQLRCHTSFAP